LRVDPGPRERSRRGGEGGGSLRRNIKAHRCGPDPRPPANGRAGGYIADGQFESDTLTQLKKEEKYGAKEESGPGSRKGPAKEKAAPALKDLTIGSARKRYFLEKGEEKRRP